MKTGLRFSAFDTWFFREARPMDAVGGAELGSLFPPPPRTVLGAIRTAVGDVRRCDWTDFARDPGHPLRSLIGYGDDCGPLAMDGPWVSCDGARLFPAPANLLAGGPEGYVRLAIGGPVATHLGRVRLPRLPGWLGRLQALDQAWLAAEELTRVLAGGLPSRTVPAQALFAPEPRLGIACDPRRRTVIDGMLYQTRHLRPAPTLAIEADLRAPDELALASTVVRFGGEGRTAHLEVTEGTGAFPAAPAPGVDTIGIIAILLTAADFGGWLPPGFAPEADGTTSWVGEIRGLALRLHAAALGRTVREGGWDMANRAPRPVRSLVPAGTCYFLTPAGGDPSPDSLAEAIGALHGAKIGAETTLGRGQIACGLWNRNELDA